MKHEDQRGAEDGGEAQESGEPRTPSPHDGLFHRVFSRKRYAAELVRLAVESTSGWEVDEKRLAAFGGDSPGVLRAQARQEKDR